MLDSDPFYNSRQELICFKKYLTTNCTNTDLFVQHIDGIIQQIQNPNYSLIPNNIAECVVNIPNINASNIKTQEISEQNKISTNLIACLKNEYFSDNEVPHSEKSEPSSKDGTVQALAHKITAKLASNIITTTTSDSVTNLIVREIAANYFSIICRIIVAIDEHAKSINDNNLQNSCLAKISELHSELSNSTHHPTLKSVRIFPNPKPTTQFKFPLPIKKDFTLRRTNSVPIQMLLNNTLQNQNLFIETKLTKTQNTTTTNTHSLK